MAIAPQTELERRVVGDPEWQDGAAWGTPRPGHPEGSVAAHIEAVLSNIDAAPLDALDRERLRFVALVHDTFKHRVHRGRPRTGDNHHAVIARRFAERYTDDDRADTRTGNKSREPLEWFEQLAGIQDQG